MRATLCLFVIVAGCGSNNGSSDGNFAVDGPIANSDSALSLADGAFDAASSADLPPPTVGAHPYLFFNDGDRAAIQARTQSGSPMKFRHFLQRTCEIRLDQDSASDFSSSWNNRDVASDMELFAFYGWLTRNDANVPNSQHYTDRAKELLLALSAWTSFGSSYDMAQGDVLSRAAISYDILYNDLSPTERQTVQKFLAMGAKFLSDGGHTGPEWGYTSIRPGNWRTIIYAGIGLAGMALWNEDPSDAPTWVNESTTIMKKTLDEDFDADGAMYEPYIRYAAGVMYHSLVPTMQALRRVTGADLFSYSDALRRGATFAAYLIYPTRDLFPSFGDNDEANYSAGLPLLISAAEYSDGVSAFYLNYMLQDYTGGSVYWGDNEAIWGTLWAKDITAQNPDSAGLPLAKAYNSNPTHPWHFGTGHVVLRTGFGSPDDVQLVLQAGDAGGFHSHADKGAYVLNAYGVHFLGDYFDSDYTDPRFTWYKSGEAHNSLLIDGEGQGAQNIGLDDPHYQDKVADVEALEMRTGYDYVRINLTGAYRINPANANLMSAYRSLAFVRGANRSAYVVAIDDVQRDSSGHTYSHPFHYSSSVSVQSAQGNQILVGNSTAQLAITAVFPQSGVTTSSQSMYSDNYLRMSATGPAHFQMMTVLYPIRAGDSAPSVSAQTQGSMIGAKVGAATIWYDTTTRVVSATGL